MTTLKVKEMSCSHCVSRIDNALNEAGIAHQVDLNSKTVAVEGDESIVNKAIDELDDIGFTASKE